MKVRHHCNFAIVFAAGLFGTVGCVPHAQIHVSPAGQQAPKGLVYYLPKAFAKLDFKLHMKTECNPSAATCQLVPSLSIEDATLDTVAVPDTTAAFILDSSDEDSIFVKTTFTAELNSTGELTSADSQDTSQALALASVGIGIASTAAKALLMGDSEKSLFTQVKELRELSKRYDEQAALLRSEMVVAAKLNAGANARRAAAKPRKLADIASDLKTLSDAKKEIAADLATIEKLLSSDVTVPITCYADLSGDATTIAVNDGNCPAVSDSIATVERALVANLGKNRFPRPAITLQLSNPTVLAGPSAPVDKPAQGIAYRLPAWYDIQLRISLSPSSAVGAPAAVTGQHPIATYAQVRKAIPQRGKIAVLDVPDNHLKSDGHVVVKLHPGLGSIQSVTFSSAPFSPDDAKSAATAITTLASTLQGKSELDSIKDQTALMTAQTEYLQAKAALEAAQKASEAGK
jgi:hypothetical protein